MRIYILRHGIAEDAAPASSDAQRALTPEGKQKLRSVLKRALHAGIRPDSILTSPYKRAMETASIAAEILGVEASLSRTAALTPSGSPDRVWREIRSHESAELLIAGHEPLLSALAAYLLGVPGLQIKLKKATLVALEVETAQAQPHGMLLWMLTPKLAVG